MSHVWGQTLPSNYGRLSPSAQREFNTDLGAGELIEKAIKEAGQKAIKEVREELGEVLAKQLTPELIEKAEKQTAKQLAAGATGESAEVLLKKNLKNMAEEAGSKGLKEGAKDVTAKIAREGTEENIEKLLKNAPETVLERQGKRAMKYGAVGITTFAVFNSFINSDAVDDYIASTTGRDCDEKAVEAELEPGTEEYTEHVTTCQEKAVENMAFLGKIMTYGGLGIGALIAVSILGKIGIFSGSGSSDEE